MTEVPRHDVPVGGRSGFATVDGRQVHYLEWGHRGLPPVLCLHGGGQTAYMYEDLGSALAGAAHVLAPDLPAHGDSDAALTELGNFSMPGLIAATMPPLLDEFGMEQVAVVGASLGGMTAIKLADEHPDRVAGIVLIDVGHKLEPEGVRRIVDFMTAHESFATVEEAAEAISEYLPQRKAVRPASLTRNLRQRADGRWEWKHGVGRRMREAEAEGVELPHPADDLDSVLEGIEDAAGRLRCPVLVLRGEQSDVLSVGGADELVDLIPDAELAIVERAGHLAAGDNPRSTTALVRAVPRAARLGLRKRSLMDALHTFSLADVPREHRRSYPNRVAVVDGGTRLTWPQHDERVNRLANALVASDVSRGDVVLWTGQNSHRILECLAAVAKIGAVVCVVNWRQSADELTFVLGDADAKVVIWQEEEVGEAVRTAFASSGAGGRWLRHDADAQDPEGYEAFLASGSPDDPALEVDPSDPVLMLYTAAFLGTPNGALLSHQAVLVQSLMMANLQRIDASYTYLNSGPLFHVATLMTTLATYVFAGTNVFVPRPEAHELCRVIEAEHCTGAFLMGPTIDQILAANEDGRYDLSSLRTFRGRSAWNKMITVDESPWALKPAGFGQTEVMGMLTYNAVGGEGEGSAGRPSPLAAVRIVDPDGTEVAPGETGEIVARGPQVMTGYRNRPEETGQRQLGGWHHTGDLGRREADGSLSFVGPKGRLIKSAAENIYPAEVEAALTSHPAVREAAVIGVPDPTWAQSVRAIVVLEEGQGATEQEIIDHVRARIVSYKKPKSVVFRSEPLPRNGWPIDYDILDAEYGGGGYPGSG